MLNNANCTHDVSKSLHVSEYSYIQQLGAILLENVKLLCVCVTSNDMKIGRFS